MTLYRKYRPQTFAEIVGQEHVTKALLAQLESGKISHAYLFSGPRGTGKTSSARIFAKALNCQKYSDKKFGEPCNECENCLAITEGSFLDVLEIDAASNRGIDEIRDLREKIRLAPISGKYKVYIIDEVHMLTNEAFNALLKTLEEPPEHAVFILATTELHKVPATIQSRTQRFQMELPSREKIQSKLARIAEKEGFKLPSESLEIIAQVSEAAYRDAEVLLEKVASVNSSASKEEVEKILGKQNQSKDLYLLQLLIEKNTKEAILWIKNFVENGSNVKVFNESLISLLRVILMIKVGIDQKPASSLSPEDYEKLEVFAKQIPQSKLTSWINLFTQSINDIKDSPIPQLPLELAIVEACDFNDGGSVEIEKPKPVELVVTKVEEIKVEKEPEVEQPVETRVEVEIVPQVDIIEEAPIVEEKIVEEIKTEEVKSDNLEAVSNVSLTELHDKWLDILKLVKPQNNSVEIFLRSASPIGIEDDLITLEVGFSFHKERLEEPKNNRILSTAFSDALGRPVRIKVVVGERKVKPKVEAEVNPIDEADPVEIFGKLV